MLKGVVILVLMIRLPITSLIIENVPLSTTWILYIIIVTTLSSISSRVIMPCIFSIWLPSVTHLTVSRLMPLLSTFKTITVTMS